MEQWRPSGWRQAAYLSPLLLVVLTGLGPLLGLLQPGADELSTADVWILVGLVASASLSAVVALRMRVRLLPKGLEIREVRTRTYPWTEIADVRLDRWSRSRLIRITLRDGTTRRLPTPTARRSNTPDAVVAAAVAAIEARLPAGRTPAPDDGFTSLDELLQE